ncbi:serpin [Aphelenchoides avenae]|nr:serpin [Aphelenchus avenae]
MVEAQADLAATLLRETSLVDPSASVIISPISIAIALSMVYVGAKRESKRELRTLLAGDTSDAHLLEYFESAVHYLGAHHNNYSLESANKVYVDKSIRVLQAYRHKIRRHFNGGFERIDVKDAYGTAKKINDFVDEATSHKITEVIRAQEVQSNSRLFLVNALHFKGEWTEKFYRQMSSNESFYTSEGQSKLVTMMHQKSFFIYFEDDQAQVLGLSYKGNEVFMFVILPKERYGLGELLRNLNGKKLTQYITKRASKEVELFLPRFKVESSFELSKALQKLGLISAFDDHADFSGITDSEEVHVGKVIHRAVIEVNEEGTEAAAVTVVAMPAGSSGHLPPKPTQFRADHPFAYAIVDSHAKVLFFGKVATFP